MKIPRTLKIKATTLILIAGSGGALFAYADDAVIRKAGITEFQSERIKCYCTEDGKVGLRLQGGNLDKHFRSTDGSVGIYQCGKSNRVLILLRADSAVGGNSTCYESAERVLGDRCYTGETADLLAKQYVQYNWPIGNMLRSTGPIAVHRYPLAHSIVAYLDSLGRARFSGFIEGLKNGATVARALADNYDGLTTDQLEAGWRSVVRERHGFPQP